MVFVDKVMNILSIAGSDPSAGAGIQNDLKTFSALGAHGLTVITAITSQNTKKFESVQALSLKAIKDQIDSVFTDFKTDAIKVGMVYNSNIIKAIYSKLKDVKIPIIVDPVIISTTGGRLLSKNSMGDFKKLIVPLAYIITPNIFEAERLSGIKIEEKQDLVRAAQRIKKFGAKNVVITGIQFDKGKISDFVLSNSDHHFLSAKKISNEVHGSGCTFSASLAVAIAKGYNIIKAVRFAKRFSYVSLKNAQKVGKGFSVAKIDLKLEKPKRVLESAIAAFTRLPNVHLIIPECQTNFVLSKQNPKSTKDILGVSGRIVKSGKEVVVAGDLKWGGSKHVATAVLTLNKKFPQTRSALNVKFDPNLIRRFKKKGFVITSYDRAKEPMRIKNKEGSTVSWGIKNAIQNFEVPPDVIYHKGDVGKEPMILVFGQNPNEVVSKVSTIL